MRRISDYFMISHLHFTLHFRLGVRRCSDDIQPNIPRVCYTDEQSLPPLQQRKCVVYVREHVHKLVLCVGITNGHRVP